MTCPYINSLNRECGRDAPPGHHGFCPLHAVLDQLDGMFLHELQYSTWSSTPILDRVRTRLHTRIGELT